MRRGKVDGLDMDIVRELFRPGVFQWNFRESLSNVSRAVGVDEETVRVRLKRMEADGVLNGVDVIVNPTLLGRHMVQLRAGMPSGRARAEAIERLKLVDGVLWIYEDMGPWINITAMVEPGGTTERLQNLVASITGSAVQSGTVPMPPCAIEPTPADWQLIQALRRGARAPYEELADATGMSEKTVRRRVQRMIEAHALMLNPHIDYSRIRGIIPTIARVVLRDPTNRHAVDSRLAAIPHTTFRSFHGPYSSISFGAESPAQMRELQDWLDRCDDVVEAQVDVCINRVTVDAWMDEHIARRATGKTASAIQE